VSESLEETRLRKPFQVHRPDRNVGSAVANQRRPMPGLSATVPVDLYARISVADLGADDHDATSHGAEGPVSPPIHQGYWPFVPQLWAYAASGTKAASLCRRGERSLTCISTGP